MFTKEQKSKILERFDNKEEKIIVSNVLDKAYRYEKNSKIEITNFLNLNEFNIVSNILDGLKIEYSVYHSNKYSDKKVIFFLPEYITNKEDVFKEYISCLKITPNVKGKLKHKDYMGSIYNLGIKKENIGDIFVIDDICYLFILKNVEEYFIQNLLYVGKNDVSIENIDIISDEIKNIEINIKESNYTVISYRVDAICSAVYNLSRMSIKEKILKGELYINDRICYFPDTILKEDDIVSLRRCGKMVIKEKIKETKNGKIMLKIGKFC